MSRQSCVTWGFWFSLLMTAGCATPSAEFNFEEISDRIDRVGIDATLAEMKKQELNDDEQCVWSVLDSTRAVIRDHPGQLWFQLQAHSRWQGWEGIQQTLMKCRPASDRFMAVSSLLPSPCLATRRTWDLSDRSGRQPSPVLFAKGPEANKVYCGLVAPDELISIDAETEVVTTEFSLPSHLGALAMGTDGVLRAASGGGIGRSYGMAGRGDGCEIRDARTGEVIQRLKDRVETPIAISPDGNHVVFWNGSSFTSREIAAPSNSFRFRSRQKPDVRNQIAIYFASLQKLIAIDEAGYLREFAFPTGNEIGTPSQLVVQVDQTAISPDGRRLACCGRVNFGPPRDLGNGSTEQDRETILIVWDVEQREVVAEFSVSRPDAEKKLPSVTAMKFVDADFIITGNNRGEVQTWIVGRDSPVATIPVLFPETSSHGRKRPGSKPELITMYASPVMALHPVSRKRTYIGSPAAVRLVDLSVQNTNLKPIPTHGSPAAVTVGEPYQARFEDGCLRIQSNQFVNDGVETFTLPATTTKDLLDENTVRRGIAKGTLVVSPNNNHAISVSSTGVLLFWDLVTNSMELRLDLRRQIEGLEYDGTYLTVIETKRRGGRRHVLRRMF